MLLQPLVVVVAVFDCGVCTVPPLDEDDVDDDEDDDVVAPDDDEEDAGASPHTFFPLLTFWHVSSCEQSSSVAHTT